jgi:hypothetical protein
MINAGNHFYSLILNVTTNFYQTLGVEILHDCAADLGCHSILATRSARELAAPTFVTARIGKLIVADAAWDVVIRW